MYMYVKMMREWSRIRDFEIREDLFNVFLKSTTSKLLKSFAFGFVYLTSLV